ncbi:DUF3592 domain-containing protein [Longispora sp. NPDC051575]|uniref:DUF3592 domain-containing protein n=1 Tax=Longispora sp. NPDC051575 TaxID=3154943 RepID=UPI0034255AE5
MENPPTAFVVAFVAVALVMLAVPLLAIGFGLRSRRRARQFRSSGRPATATVVDNQMTSGAGGRLFFSPVVRFRTDSGTEVTGTTSHRPTSAIVGSTMEVVYDPENPSRVEPAAGGGAAGTAAIIFGLVTLAMLLVFFFLAGSMFSLFPAAETADCPPNLPADFPGC